MQVDATTGTAEDLEAVRATLLLVNAAAHHQPRVLLPFLQVGTYGLCVGLLGWPSCLGCVCDRPPPRSFTYIHTYKIHTHTHRPKSRPQYITADVICIKYCIFFFKQSHAVPLLFKAMELKLLRKVNLGPFTHTVRPGHIYT